MTEREKKAKKSLQKRFLELTQSKGFLQIEEIVARLDRGKFWPEGFMDGALYEAKKAYARKVAQAIKLPDGHRAVHSVEIENADGDSIQVYMQLALFEVAHFQQAVIYHTARANHHIGEARYLAAACQQKYGVQLELTFDAAPQPLRAARRATKQIKSPRSQPVKRARK